jgi:plasmid stabilization system protein ParE
MTASYQIIISPEDADDLNAIYEYIAQDSPRNAAIFVERILTAIERLGAFPHRTIVT